MHEFRIGHAHSLRVCNDNGRPTSSRVVLDSRQHCVLFRRTVACGDRGCASNHWWYLLLDARARGARMGAFLELDDCSGYPEQYNTVTLGICC